MGPDVDLADQDFKATIINIFIELKENVFNELKINVLVCQKFFWQFRSFPVPQKFQNQLVSFCKRACRDFDTVYTESIDPFGEK